MMPAPTASPVAAVLPRRSALSLRLATELVILCLLVAAPLLGLPPYFASLAIEIFLFSILAMSLDLLLGYTGLVSLGHAAFFAAGAYATGIVANQLTPELWVTIPAGIAVAEPGRADLRLDPFLGGEGEHLADEGREGRTIDDHDVAPDDVTKLRSTPSRGGGPFAAGEWWRRVSV